ncbi:MAG TPA: hypothetical protein VEC96_13090 [Anaerolineae bacterium]|nr:hypothetical protein [Anaerolineae bacterium]HXW01036.1 hypothetical protein [Anaerolineae bacterium]
MCIKTVNEDEVTGVAVKIYKGSSRFWSKVNNVIKAHSSTPAALCALMAFYWGVYFYLLTTHGQP